MLFSSTIDKSSEPKYRNETNFEFLNRSSWRTCEIARQKFNEFCLSYVPDEEFLKMFKSKSSKQYYSAVFEILVYTILSRSNLILSRHPETKTGKKPDFLAIHQNLKLYIECTLAGNSYEREEEKNRKETVEDIIENMDYFPYFVNLTFECISPKSISRKKLILFLNQIKEKSEGVPDELLRDMSYMFTEDDWEIEISVFRKQDKNIRRSLGFIMNKAKVIEPQQPILTALNDKRAQKYGIETESYVICLNTSDLFTDRESFCQTLFGQCGDSIDLNKKAEKGFYIFNGKPINTTVSAIIFFRNFDIFTLNSSSITVWHNPFAKNKLPLNIMPFDEYTYNLNGKIIEPALTKKEVDVF